MPGTRLSYELLIREGHLDSYGHVNNATYLSLYEEARWDYITTRGYGYHKVHELGIGPVILEAHVWFRKELKLRERVTITGEMTEHGSRTGKMKQRILDSGGKEYSSAEFVFGLFDLRQRKLIRPTPEWLHAIGWAEEGR